MRSVLAAVLALLVSLAAKPAIVEASNKFETAAKAAILIDHRNGTVLFDKNADQPIEPASMSKLMTALMVFEALEAGTLSLEQALPVSKKAWRMGGSRMFVEVDTRVTVEDLLRGVIVQSGNDACVVLAEALAGSEEAFAARMTERAKAMGLRAATFKNATGWPDPEHLMSVRDLATIAKAIIDEYPQYYEFYGIKEFTYNDITQANRNPLLQAGIVGVDGMKTGYTRSAGYGLVASAERDARRLILVVAGLESPRQRRTESERLLEHGFRDFTEYRLFDYAESVVNVPVWQGAAPDVPLVGEGVIGVTLERPQRDGLEVDISYDTPVVAPIEQGQQLGRMRLHIPGEPMVELPLVAGEAVPRAGVGGRMMGALNYLLWGLPKAP